MRLYIEAELKRLIVALLIRFVYIEALMIRIYLMLAF